jgi:signal transduction histidine kinase
MKLSPVKLDIFRLVQDIFLMFAEKAELKRIRMISEVIPGTTAWSDTDAIVLILRNLISNAIKFTGKGGLVTVSAIPTGQMLMITVADTGIGIVAGNIEKLFRFEHQFRQEGTEKEKGSGLGLVLCNDVVTKLGGRIWVESIEGAGSRFSFSIPFFPVVLDSKF